MNKLNKIIDKYLVILFFVTLLGLFLRTYKIGEFPVHLGHDEVTQLYDAISIADTGKDIYGESYPFIFKSVNDFKPPFYTYSTVLFYKLLGWQNITIKATGILFGTLMIPAVYLFTYALFRNKKIAIIAGILTAISPFEIFYSRKGFENQAGISLFLIGSSLLLFGLKNKKHKNMYFAGFIVCAIAMYTYFSHAIIIPLLLLPLMYIYRKEIGKKVAAGILIFLLIAAPLYYLIATDPNSGNRTKAVSITQDSVFNEHFYDEEKSILGRYSSGAMYVTDRFLDHLSPTYLFINGLDLTNREYVDVGIFYPLGFPFLLLGVYYLYKERKLYRKPNLLIISWVVISLIPSALTFEKYSPHRSILTNSLINIVIAAGIFYLGRLVANSKHKKFGYLIFGLITVGFVYYFGYFWSVYTLDYPTEKSQYIHYPYKEVAEYAWSVYDDYDQIIFDPKFGEVAPFIGTGVHYYLAYYGDYHPSLIQESFRIGDQEKRETIFDKLHIRAVYWPEDKDLDNALIIASPWSLPVDIGDQTDIIKSIYFYNSEKPAFTVVTSN